MAKKTFAQTAKSQISLAKVTKEITQKIRNVGDDILDIMEKAGGHTLEKHVSQTEQELIRRAIQKDLSSSAFIDKRAAVNAVKENLRNNADNIIEWVKISNDGVQKAFEYTHQYSIGKGVFEASKHLVNNLATSNVVLEKDGMSKLGFKIITSFPVVK